MAILLITIGLVSCRKGSEVPTEEPFADGDIAKLRSILPRDIVRWTNFVRKRHGAPPLFWNRLLAKAALSHSEEMARLHYFDHRSPIPKHRALENRLQRIGYMKRLVRKGRLLIGENIAKTTARSGRAKRVVDSWMESESHRRNLLNPVFRYIGVGVAWDGGSLLATQVFSNRR